VNVPQKSGRLATLMVTVQIKTGFELGKSGFSLGSLIIQNFMKI